RFLGPSVPRGEGGTAQPSNRGTEQPMPIRIVIADDHPVVRRGLSQFFADEEEMEIVAECADGNSALEETLRLEPDVLIVDLRMPVVSGLDVLRRLKEKAR